MLEEVRVKAIKDLRDRVEKIEADCKSGGGFCYKDLTDRILALEHPKEPPYVLSNGEIKRLTDSIKHMDQVLDALRKKKRCDPGGVSVWFSCDEIEVLKNISRLVTSEAGSKLGFLGIPVERNLIKRIMEL